MSTLVDSPPKVIQDTTPSWQNVQDSAIENNPQLPAPEETQSDSLPWILYHILERELSSELPLRIMFSFNAGQQLPTLKQAHDWWQYEPKGKLIIDFLSGLPRTEKSAQDAWDTIHEAEGIPITPSKGPKSGKLDPEQDPIDQFMDVNHSLLFDVDFGEKLSDKGNSRQGFPPKFIQDLCLKKVFLKEYKEVDFNQALTGLDYLRDLEVTRRKALREAAIKLGIAKDTWRTVLLEDPAAYKWVQRVQDQELEIEGYYADIFIDLRIWTMVHELQATPFYKPNVLAMLNTLFPPSLKEMPNDRIDIKALHRYRTTFFEYITQVEAKGAGILKPFVDRLLDPETKHSWTKARKNLEAYIDLADQMIKEARAIYDIKLFRESGSHHSRSGSRTHSSFSDRPHTASSANTSLDGRHSSLSNNNFNPKELNSKETKESNHNDSNTTVAVPKSPPMVPPESFSIRSRIFSRKRMSGPQHIPEPGLAAEPLESRPAPAPVLDFSPMSLATKIAPPEKIADLQDKARAFAQRKRTEKHGLSHSGFGVLPIPKKTPKPILSLRTSHAPAANHDAFSAPILSPQTAQYREFKHRKAISNENRPSSEAIFSSIPDVKSRDFAYPPPPPEKEEGNLSRVATKNTLAYEQLDFLNHPYSPERSATEPAPTTASLKKKSSLGSLFNRRKSTLPSEKMEKSNPVPFPSEAFQPNSQVVLARQDFAPEEERFSPRKLTKQKSLNFEGKNSVKKEMDVRKKRSFSSGLKYRASTKLKEKEGVVKKEMIGEPLFVDSREGEEIVPFVLRTVTGLGKAEKVLGLDEKETVSGRDSRFVAPRAAPDVPVPEERFVVDVSRFSKY
ncbi:hypothetical protein BGZ60DRAFT_530482 [Tricladium varicosporioides]|nr:hypothetical protein BGZ60DRAFT_530482 [Hymenoscyphus varicosporioides]